MAAIADYEVNFYNKNTHERERRGYHLHSWTSYPFNLVNKACYLHGDREPPLFLKPTTSYLP